MAQISLRVDDDVKRGAEQTFDDIGLSMSTAINIFLKKGCQRAAYTLWIVCWSILFRKQIWRTCDAVLPPLMPEKA